MAVKTRLTGTGNIIDMNLREGTTTRDGKPVPYRIVNALLVGPGTLVEFRIPSDLENLVRAAHKDQYPVTVGVTIGSYRDDDQADLTSIEKA